MEDSGVLKAAGQGWGSEGVLAVVDWWSGGLCDCPETGGWCTGGCWPRLAVGGWFVVGDWWSDAFCD